MKSAEHMEKLVRRLAVKPDAAMRERTLADATAAHTHRTGGPLQDRAPLTHRRIPAAMAAGLMLLCVLGAFALHESGSQAYAVEQTVAAIKKVPVVHILGRDWDDKRIEMWIKVNPDTGLMDSCHIAYRDDNRYVVSTPKNTYDYDGRTNAVRIKDGPSVTSIFDLGDFFRGMERLAQTLDGRVTCCKVADPAAKREMLELKLSAPQTEIICLIDPRTKLPAGINVTRGGRLDSSDILKHATEIRYSDAPPEGLFDFAAPGGATVSVETSDDPLRSMPADVLQYCGQFHLKTVQEKGDPQGLGVNTRVYFVNSEFTLNEGGLAGIRNDSNDVWQGEIGVFNVDFPHMALFDAVTGQRQKIRLVQHRQSPPGRFKVRWQLEEALNPGQTRYVIWWTSETKELPTLSSGGPHSLVMNNCLGGKGIENFLLIVPKGMKIADSSRPPEVDREVDGHRVYAWQRELPEERIVNQVDVTLSRSSAGWFPSDAWMIVGPFDNAEGTGFRNSYPPETETDFSKEYAGKNGPVTWFKPKPGRMDGFVDLAALVGRHDWSVAYAAATLQSPADRAMELRVGSDDDVKAWLNGELVLSRQADRAALADQDVVPVTLRQGENRLLLKICNREYSWGFYARIVDANEPRLTPLPPPAEITRKAAAEDLAFLVEQLKKRHPRPFAKTSEEAFRGEIERIEATLPEPAPTRDFSLAVAALLAKVGDDHTTHRDVSAYEQHVKAGGRVFPVRLRCQEDRMTVDAWSPEVSPAKMKTGDAITAVNGCTIESLVQKYGRYLSFESDTQRRWAMEWWFDKYQVLLGDARDEYVLGLQDAEGHAYVETLPAVKPWLQAYVDAKAAAPQFHHQFYDDGKTCLLKLQTFNWSLRTELEPKLNALVDAMKRNKTEIAVLDLRGNGGGNSAMGSLVLARMIDKPCGDLRPDPNHCWPVRIAVLCDRSTYSAASSTAMFCKDGKIAIIAGEETGGRASFFGNIEHVTLPNSRLVCGIATRYFLRQAGYDDGRGVLPDLPLDVTLPDSVLVEKIRDHIHNSGG